MYVCMYIDREKGATGAETSLLSDILGRLFLFH